MNYKQVPELQSLLDAVEKKFGTPLRSTNDFNVLSAVLKIEGSDALSASTLKRLWHYVSQETTPRRATLDVLSRFVGFKDFKDFRLSKLGEVNDSSAYLDNDIISADEIQDARTLTIGWEPDRVVKLRKIGDNMFEVAESLNSKLQNGDRLQCSCFFKGLPLVVPFIERGGNRMPSYIAGKKGGLNVLRLDS